MGDSNSKSDTAQTKKGNAQRKKAELREKRAQQLTTSRNAAEQLAKHLKAQHENLRLCKELLDHSDGFYVEVNKLTKGRMPLPATPLVRETVNDIISDAKKLIKTKEDVHMDRIKEFVPAGDEPSYPDVLVVTGSVRHCLQRHRDKQIARITTLQARSRIIATVTGALQYFLNDENASEVEREYPSKEAVRLYTDGSISNPCFSQYSDSSDYYFDFDKLDSMTVQDFLSTVASDSGDDDEEDLLSDDSDQIDDEDETGGENDEG
jgi:hypothetical protein